MKPQLKGTEVSEPSRDEKIQALTERIEKSRDNELVFQRNLKECKEALAKADEVQARSVSNFLDKFSDLSPNKIMEKVYKDLPNENRAQLLGNISKIETAIAVETANISRFKNERQKFLIEIENEKKDARARAVCEALKKWVEAYGVVEDQYEELFHLAAEARSLDRKYFTRVTDLGYPRSYLAILDSYLKTERLSEMDMTYFADELSKLDAYGPPLVGRKLRPTAPVPLERDTFFNQEGASIN